MGKKKTYFPEESHCRRPSSIQLSTFNVLTSLYYALRGRDIVMYQCACVRVEERDILFIIHLFFLNTQLGKTQERLRI